MNKFKFIQHLLENEKFDFNQKERFFKLVSKELEKPSELDILNLKQDIDDIKKKLGISNLPKKEETEKSNGLKIFEEALKNEKETNIPKYIDPFSEKGISKFLKAYNENPILKTTCHEIDSESSLKIILEYCKEDEYNFSTHLQFIKFEFDKLTKEYNINKKLYSLIRAYIYGGIKWSTDKLQMSWSDKELLDWSDNNPKIIPNPGFNLIEKYETEGYSLSTPFRSTLTGKNIITFSDFVLLFKSMFHINSNNSLKKHLVRVIRKMEFKEWFDIEINENKFGENIHIYTDVDKLIQSFVKIVELVKSINKEYSVVERPQLLISFFEQENDVIFSIHHLNSIYKKSLMSTLSHPFGESTTPIIEKQINGLCNLELIANFDNNDFARINLWNGSKVKILEKFESFEGVEYVLKFKR
ncbi:hypothetical protein GCM10011416_00940 [Polaribacter pacificus]|uniref:Histidine Kinase domain-containing protein n=1 Tax=Polaribacter pacificus TaxID=1775173 RepID=A0A917M9Y8_9FLAO|nr:hypothetical protein [Polaribacter pacificus]GGG88509.1 hypothetical protein GCM10011416_00940 [Polaribacter pacificus]